MSLKVVEPSKWVSSMVTVVKPGKDKYSICLDPKHLYEAITHEPYLMKTTEEIVARKPNAKVFNQHPPCQFWLLVNTSRQSN